MSEKYFVTWAIETDIYYVIYGFVVYGTLIFNTHLHTHT